MAARIRTGEHDISKNSERATSKLKCGTHKMRGKMLKVTEKRGYKK